MRTAATVLGELGEHRAPSKNDVSRALRRLLESPHLEASDRRRAFLRYIVEETLEGRGEYLKGYTIALSVFGRDESFDSRADPVVRLEARRLRRDLDSYYVDAGRADPVRITIPKGGYVPAFEWQGQPPAEAAIPAGSQDAAAPGTTEAIADDLPAPAPSPSPPAAGIETAARPAPQETPGPSEITAAPALDPIPASLATPTAPPAPRRRRFGARPLVLLAGLLCVVLIAAGLWLLLFRAPEPPVATGQRDPALVVLPFHSVGQAAEQAFLADGISEELIGHLMRFPSLRVYTRAVNLDRGAGQDAPARLGRDLGVAYVVSGTVRVQGEDVRVGTQLTDAATGEVIWAGTYDRPLTPDALIALQSDLAGEIASALAQPYGVVSRDIGRRSRASPTESLQNYLCVQKAHAYRRTFVRTDYAPALACIEGVVQRDPNYSDALAMLAWLKLDAGRFGFDSDVPQAESYRRAHEAATRALALDPGNVLAIKALSSINHYMGNYAEGERLARQAVEQNPYDPDAIAQLGWRLAVRGNFEEGIPLVERAIGRSADAPAWYYHLITIEHYLRGEYEEMLHSAVASEADGLGISQALIAIAAAELNRPELARSALANMETYPRIAEDPTAYFHLHGATDEIVDALTEGLAKARRVAAAP